MQMNYALINGCLRWHVSMDIYVGDGGCLIFNWEQGVNK